SRRRSGRGRSSLSRRRVLAGGHNLPPGTEQLRPGHNQGGEDAADDKLPAKPPLVILRPLAVGFVLGPFPLQVIAAVLLVPLLVLPTQPLAPLVVLFALLLVPAQVF